MINTFYIADTHFCHRNIIEFCSRPFKDVQQMNQIMIDNWNSVVKKDDIVVHGGDFSFANKLVSTEIFNALNGQKYLVRGNHDGTVKWAKSIGFLDVLDYWYSNRILVWHNPDRIQDFMINEEDILLYGHAHNNWKFYLKNSYCISVECIGYIPRRIEEIIR